MSDDIDDMPDVPLNLDGHLDAEVATEEAPKETETPATDKPETDTKDEKTTEGEQQPAEATDKVDEAKPDPNEQERQRAENARYAAMRVQERQRAKDEVARKLDQTYGPRSEADLYQENLDKGMSEELAQVRAESQALREQVEYANQRSQISELNSGLQAEAVNVEYDFPIYRELNPDGSKNPDYDPDFTSKVQAGYQRRAGVQVDEDTGLILSANESLYDYYKEMAEYRQLGAKQGATQGQAEMQQMLSRTDDAPGGNSPGNRGAETLEEMGERLADVPIY